MENKTSEFVIQNESNNGSVEADVDELLERKSDILTDPPPNPSSSTFTALTQLSLHDLSQQLDTLHSNSHERRKDICQREKRQGQGKGQGHHGQGQGQGKGEGEGQGQEQGHRQGQKMKSMSNDEYEAGLALWKDKFERFNDHSRRRSTVSTVPAPITSKNASRG